MLPYVLALIRSSVASIRRDEGGQGMVEYALILAFVALGVIGALSFIGDRRSARCLPVDPRRVLTVSAHPRTAGPPHGGRRSRDSGVTTGR